MLMTLLGWIIQNKKTVLYVSVVAFFAITHYYAYSRGIHAERLKNLRSENAALVEMAKEFASIKQSYDGLMLDLPKSSIDTGPAVSTAITRLPKPTAKPR